MESSHRLRRNLVALLVILLGGCSKEGETPAPPAPAPPVKSRPAAPAPPRTPVPPAPEWAGATPPPAAPQGPPLTLRFIPPVPESAPAANEAPPQNPLARPDDDPVTAAEEALSKGRLEEAARLIEKIAATPRGADPAVLGSLRNRLELALTRRVLRGAFDSGKEAAQARLSDAKEAVARDLREESEREGRIERALKELTARAPLRVPLSENATLENVRVTSYAAGRVKLAWPQGEVEYPFEHLPEETRAALLTGALATATPRDHFEIGKLLVQGKDYGRAARCFAIAGQRDPALAPFAPDLERVKRAARLFEGTFKAAGNTLGLSWSFGSPDEAKDFVALQGTLAVRPGQGLEVEGPKLALAAVREIPFRDRVRVSALARETEAAAHLMGLRFTKPDGGEVLIYGALATSLKAFLVMRLEDDKSRELLAPTPGAAGNRMTMEFNRGRCTFQVGDRTVWSGNEGGFTDVTVIVGGSAIPRQGAPSKVLAQFREVTLLGGVNPLWMAKKTAGLRDALTSELSKEYRADRPESSSKSLEMSVEPAVSRAAEPTRVAYREALAKVAKMRQTMLSDDLVAASRAMERVTEVDPSFAPAWHFRGVLEETSGNLRIAGEDYDRALDLLPDFPEALCARGRLHALAGKWDRVRECAERALALKPDVPEAHLLRARASWESKNPAEALEAAGIARRLAPLDPRVRSDAQMLANVVRGPAWPRPNVHATAHYSVRSDLPEAKCRLYAQHLEGVRPVYEEVLGRSPPAGRPAGVLIFNSEEGYFNYMDFTAGNRQEHTLGAFSPWHGQMALFEGVEPAETLRVISHEGFHQFLHDLAPDVPIWFNEGMAEYVGASRVESGKVVERGGILEDRLDNLKMALKYGWSPVAFEEIMLESKSEFYGEQAPLKYAQAWSMIRYFMQGDDGRWRGLLREYTDRLLAGESALASFEATFAKQNLPQMEASWMKHYGLVASPPRAKARPAAPKPGLPPAGGAIDLIALLGSRGPLPEGWKLSGTTMESPAFGGVPIDLGYEPPAEYDVRLVVQRIRGDGALCLGLQGGGRSFLLRLDEKGASGLEAVDGKNDPNETSKRGGPTLPLGRPVTVLCSVRKDALRATVDGSVVLDWKGALGRLSLPTTLTMPVPAKTLFAVTFYTQFSMAEITARAVSPVVAAGLDAGVEKPPGALIKVDPLRAIPLEAAITQWWVDGENDQILAVDPASNSLLQISISQRKVLRRIQTGSEPSALCPGPGTSKSVWVGHQGAQTLVRVDLEKGAITDTVPAAFLPAVMVAIRKYLWCLDAKGVLHGVDVEDKKDLGTLGYGFIGLGYDSKKDRLWGLGWQSLTDYDASKIGMIQRELQKKSLTERERLDLGNALGKSNKNYPLSGPMGRPIGYGLLVDDKNGRLYFNKTLARAEKPGLILGGFKSPSHALGSDPVVKAFMAGSPFLDEILAVSPDGKWAASGTHVFSVATSAVQKELAIPSSLVAFSKDSRTVYYFDWVNRGVGLMDVEPK